MSDHRIDAEKLLASIAGEVAQLSYCQNDPVAISLIAQAANAHALLALVDEVRGVKEQLAASLLTALGLAPQVDPDLAEDAVATVHTVIARTASDARRARNAGRKPYVLTQEEASRIHSALVGQARDADGYSQNRDALGGYSEGVEHALDTVLLRQAAPDAP